MGVNLPQTRLILIMIDSIGDYMCQTLGTAVRPIFKLLAFALFLPIITGFGRVAPNFSAAIASEEPPPAVQSPSPIAPEAADPEFNWRHNKEREPNTLDSAGPGASTTEAGVAPKKVHDWDSGASKSYLIPALEVPGFLGLLNIYDRIAYPN